MNSFTYYNPTRIVFGRDSEAETGPLAAIFAKKVLLHYGGGSIKRNGVYDKVTASLKNAGVEYVELGGVQPNPRLSLVEEGIQLARKEQVGMVLAVGGGSTIDSAKAIAAGAFYEGDVWDFYLKKDTVRSVLPVGVVLTISAAGSESSHGSVITNEEGNRKKSLNSELLIPRFAIVNPETSYTLPPFQTACGCADIIAHLIERYFTTVKAVDLSDRLIEAALRTMLVQAPLAQQYPRDYDIRAEISWAGTIAHNNLLDRGRVGDWASHMIEHELSAIYDIAHGAGLAVVIPAWMRYVWTKHPQRFVQFAVRVMDVDLSYDYPEKIVYEAIERLEGFFRALGLATRLSELGIGSERFEEMAEKAGTVGNFVKLGKEDIIAIYQLAQ